MSGPIRTEIASAASRIAAMAQCRAVVEAWPKREGKSQPGRTWAAMGLRARMVLVMLGSSVDGDPKMMARQPWGSFSEADQCRIAATRRELLRELNDAASLF